MFVDSAAFLCITDLPVSGSVPQADSYSRIKHSTIKITRSDRLQVRLKKFQGSDLCKKSKPYIAVVG